MFQNGSSHGVIKFALLAVALGMSAGCKPAGTGNVDTGDTGVVPVNAGDPGVKANKGMKGRPGKDANETRNYLLSLGWGDNYPDSLIVETQFDNGGGTALIRIVPNDNANTISWQEALGAGVPPGNGYFVAKIYNLEDKAINALGLDKLGTGYLWVGEISDTERGAAIYTVKNNGTIKASKTLKLGGYCPNEQHPFGKVELTDGHKCTGPFKSLTAGISQAAQIVPVSLVAMQGKSGPGLWVSCSGGCCEVSAQ